MIISVGVDLIEVGRIRAALEDLRIGSRFRDRVYTDQEIAYCEKKGRGRYESYAGRFAAKEAVMKALGRGWGANVAWRDIEVARAQSGKPDIVLHGFLIGSKNNVAKAQMPKISPLTVQGSVRRRLWFAMTEQKMASRT